MGALQSFTSVLLAQSSASIPEGSYKYLRVALLLPPPSLEAPKDLFTSTQ